MKPIVRKRKKATPVALAITPRGYKLAGPITKPAPEPEAIPDALLNITRGSFHAHITEGMWSAVGMIVGCGLMQVRGLEYADGADAKRTLEKLKERAQTHDVDFTKPMEERNYGCQAMVGMLGSSYWTVSRLKAIKDLGFVEVGEYYNAAHPNDNHSQKLFLLTWKVEKK